MGRMVEELSRELETVRNEVSWLHSVQSTLEAQRLCDLEHLCIDVASSLDEQQKAREQESVGRAESAEAEQELAAHFAAAVQNEAESQMHQGRRTTVAWE